VAWKLQKEYPDRYGDSLLGNGRGHMKNSKLVIWALGAVVVAAVVFLVLRPAGGVKDVDGAELAALIDQGVRVIDVRTGGEYATAHIPGAESVPLNTLQSAASTWDRQEPIAVYCASGERSASAVEYLAGAGFTTIYHLNEGMIAWSGEVERGSALASTGPVETSGIPVMYEFFTDW
jgi:rhodanese-related sulfurtransferase